MADAHAEAVEQSVGNRRRHRAMRGLAGADRADLRPLYQFDLDLRHLAEAKDRIIGPAAAGDALPVEADALLQHPAGGLDRAALDLIDDPVGIDGLADIDRDRQLIDPDVFIAFHLGDCGTIGAGVLVTGKADAVADPGSLLGFPICASCDGANDVLCARVAQMAQPERYRILAAPGGDLV